MGNNYLRQECTLANFGRDILVDANVDGGIPVADNKLGTTLPKGAVIRGLILRNLRNDLTASGAGTVQVKVGGTALGSAPTEVSDIKGTSVNVEIATPVVLTADGEVSLNVATGALTAGSLDIILLYI